MSEVGEIDYAAEMRLPGEARCDDCSHARRCFGLGFSEPGRRSCDFWPNRFRAVVPLHPTTETDNV